MRLVIGLGNPGQRFACTRHNIGFMAVAYLATRWGIPLSSDPSGFLVSGRGAVDTVQAMLIQPQTYMNASGEALMHLEISWTVSDLVVIHDDIDLAAGQLRVQHDGGFGGHLGVRSIGSICGRDFDRVRVGVGRPPQGVDPADYVLVQLKESDLTSITPAAQRAALAVECLLTQGLVQAMNRFNGRFLEQAVEPQQEDRSEQD